MKRWTAADMPSQSGRLAVITGTGGLGFETALALARAGARIVIAGRNPAKGARAIAAIRRAVPGTRISFGKVDLADLASVSSFAAQLTDQYEHLDILVNNAGVMTPPARIETRDGLELQFGTNYLAHFALTARLMPLLKRAGHARVVSLGSVAARQGRINFDDLQARNSYEPFPAYAQSKLACIMFALELDRLSRLHEWQVDSIAAHPGISRTELLPNGAGRFSLAGLMRRVLWFLFQPAWQGALPALYAATSPQAVSGCYYGPHSLSETRGYPVRVAPPALALDPDVRIRLWKVSEELAGTGFA